MVALLSANVVTIMVTRVRSVRTLRLFANVKRESGVRKSSRHNLKLSWQIFGSADWIYKRKCFLVRVQPPSEELLESSQIKGGAIMATIEEYEKVANICNRIVAKTNASYGDDISLVLLPKVRNLHNAVAEIAEFDDEELPELVQLIDFLSMYGTLRLWKMLDSDYRNDKIFEIQNLCIKILGWVTHFIQQANESARTNGGKCS